MIDPPPYPWSFPIPEYWTPAQADAVFEFLTMLAEAVYLAHERGILEISSPEATGLSSDDHEAPDTSEPDDLFPF